MLNTYSEGLKTTDDALNIINSLITGSGNESTNAWLDVVDEGPLCISSAALTQNTFLSQSLGDSCRLGHLKAREENVLKWNCDGVRAAEEGFMFLADDSNSDLDNFTSLENIITGGQEWQEEADILSSIVPHLNLAVNSYKFYSMKVLVISKVRQGLQKEAKQALKNQLVDLLASYRSKQQQDCLSRLQTMAQWEELLADWPTDSSAGDSVIDSLALATAGIDVVCEFGIISSLERLLDKFQKDKSFDANEYGLPWIKVVRKFGIEKTLLDDDARLNEFFKLNPKTYFCNIRYFCEIGAFQQLSKDANHKFASSLFEFWEKNCIKLGRVDPIICFYILGSEQYCLKLSQGMKKSRRSHHALHNTEVACILDSVWFSAFNLTYNEVISHNGTPPEMYSPLPVEMVWLRTLIRNNLNKTKRLAKMIIRLLEE